MRERRFQLLFTCEHASNRIPGGLWRAMDRAGDALQTHRGYDVGTGELGRFLATTFSAPLFPGKWSRLLIELNRSPHHYRLWSEFSRALPAATKARLLKDYYHRHRLTVETAIRRHQSSGRPVLHLGLHSFTPVLAGTTRRADIGLLYDPHRRAERDFCDRWKRLLENHDSDLVVRRNYPYRGVADGLTTHLRKQFNERRYLGIELEVNQRFPTSNRILWVKLMKVIAETLGAATAGL